MKLGLAAAAIAALIGSLPAAALAAGTAPPSVGAESTGCHGRIQSIGGNGAVLGTMVAPGRPSPSDPLLVDPAGQVRYAGATDAAITDYTWNIKVWGIRIIGGSGTNDGHATSLQGVRSMHEFIGSRVLTGLFYVSGSMSGSGGTCRGDAWIRMVGNPVGTPGWIAGFVLAALGILGLFWSVPQAAA